MQNSLWKLTALAGVVGIGSLVVLQAQRGLSRPAVDINATAGADGASTAGDPAAGASEHAGDPNAADPNGEPNALAGGDPAGTFGSDSHDGHEHGASTLSRATAPRRTSDSGNPFTEEPPGNQEPSAAAPTLASSDAGAPVEFGNEPPQPRGLDFNDELRPTPDPRGAATASSSDGDNPFGRSAPVAPQPKTMRDGRIRTVAGEESADEPGSESAASPFDAPPAARSPANEPEPAASEDNSAPTRRATPAPGPQLFVPGGEMKEASAAGNSEPAFAGDDLPSSPTPRARASEPDPFADEPQEGAKPAPRAALDTADEELNRDGATPEGGAPEFGDDEPVNSVTPAGDEAGEGEVTVPRRRGAEEPKPLDLEPRPREPQRLPEFGAEPEPTNPAARDADPFGQEGVPAGASEPNDDPTSRDSAPTPRAASENEAPRLDPLRTLPRGAEPAGPFPDSDSARPAGNTDPGEDVPPRTALPSRATDPLRDAPPGDGAPLDDLPPRTPLSIDDPAPRGESSSEGPGDRPRLDDLPPRTPLSGDFPEDAPRNELNNRDTDRNDRSLPDSGAPPERSVRPRSESDRALPDPRDRSRGYDEDGPNDRPLPRTEIPGRDSPDGPPSDPARRDVTDPRRGSPRVDPTPLDRAGPAPRPRTLPRGDGIVGSDSPKGPQKPQLKIEKVAPPNAVLGQPLVYTIHIRNVGDTAAQDVIVEDRIPKGAELIGTIPRAELVDKTLLWRLGTVQPGEEKKLAIQVKPFSEGQIGSIATVNFVAEVASKTLITAPKLQLDLIGPKQARTGEGVPYTFRIRNTGTADAKGVVIRDIVPEGLRHPDGSDLEYELGTLPAGTSREVRLTLTAVKMGEATNRAVATADGGVSIESTASVEVLGPSLSITRTGPKRSYVGRTAVFTTTVTNDSSRAINGATIVEVVPEGMDFLESEPKGFYSPERRTISWRVDGLQPQQSFNLNVKLRPKTTGAKSSVVRTIEGAGTTSEVASQTEVIGVANLDADLAGPAGNLGIGDQVTFRVVVKNRGNDAASNVRVKLQLPEQLEFVSAGDQGRPSADGREVTFAALDRLNAERTTTYDLIVRAVQPGAARLTLVYEADDMPQPLSVDEQVVILQDGEAAAVSSPRR